MALHKLFTVKGGYLHFAKVSLKTVEESTTSLIWPPAIPDAKYWAASARQGADLALKYHLETGEQPACFEITDFAFTACDTSLEDVRYATACAAWAELGRDPAELTGTWDEPSKTWIIARTEL